MSQVNNRKKQEAKLDVIVEYEDEYVQPLIIKALQKRLPQASFTLRSKEEDCNQSLPLLQIRSYESLNFERCLRNMTDLCNAYVIRKALIRKHYLSNTIFTWVTKHPDSILKKQFKPAEEFEVDYAEFLDDALVEAFDLRAAFERNEDKSPDQREWWILKPGMSDRGQGIRLFSTQDELQDIFDGWEVDDDDDEEEDVDEYANSDGEEPSQSSNGTLSTLSNEQNGEIGGKSIGDGIVTSHLRHFIAQPYIHPPLLFPEEPFRNRKFHIRTYVVAAGALRVYVYNHMLALLASETYQPPWQTQPVETSSNSDENASIEAQATDQTEAKTLALQKLQNIHLTNTCVQNTHSSTFNINDSVYLISSLPLSKDQNDAIRTQIHQTTAETFRAALAQPTNFQPLPNAFEIFGLDFLVEDLSSGNGTPMDGSSAVDKGSAERVNVQLLEVNAFPDFAQTGEELRDIVVKGLFEDVVRTIVGPFFGLDDVDDDDDDDEFSASKSTSSKDERLSKVFDMDMGRR